MSIEMFGAKEAWRVAAIEDDPDPAYAGCIFFEFRGATSRDA
jgi:hypothetical protein